jgi:hypothetical protein
MTEMGRGGGRVLSVERKFKVIREIQNGKSESGIWSRILYYPYDVEKENQNY